MRVLVCGDRYWQDAERLFAVLDALHDTDPITVLIEGCASGADRMAGEHLYPCGGGFTRGWAWERDIESDHFPADWVRYRNAAGPIRNRQMLAEGAPELVVAFHNDIASSSGTANMFRQARRAGVPVLLFRSDGEREAVP